jgi:hypothetical protein
LPSYLAREDPNQGILLPNDIISHLTNPKIAQPIEKSALKEIIDQHLKKADMVVCLAGGGGGSLDEWLREQYS